MFDRTSRLNRRGSTSRDFLDGIEGPDSSKARGGGGDGNSAWSSIARAYAPDYALLLVLAVITVLCETAAPFTKVIYSLNDQEYWKYSYPLHTSNTVPAWTVPLIAIGVPLLVLGILSSFTKPSRLELHNVILGLFAAVLITSTVTNLVKLGVGRPRPNFIARCWPGGILQFTAAGTPECDQDAINPGEGRKSFPSGHTAWTTSGLAYLTFWLAGWLRCFDGNGHPSRLLLAGLPLASAAWVGITRLQDYWHHWEDVFAGFLLGLSIAYLSYRQHYPALMSTKCGEPHISTLDSPGELQRSYQDLEAAAAQTA